MFKALLIRTLDRPESILEALENDSGLLSCVKFLALFTLEDTGLIRCGSNFTLLRKLKKND